MNNVLPCLLVLNFIRYHTPDESSEAQPKLLIQSQLLRP